MSGYILRLGPVEYDAWRDGTPFTLPDCWREAEGVGQATILSPTGRVVLRRAGEAVGRRYEVRRMAAQKREALRAHTVSAPNPPPGPPSGAPRPNFARIRADLQEAPCPIP